MRILRYEGLIALKRGVKILDMTFSTLLGMLLI